MVLGGPPALARMRYRHLRGSGGTGMEKTHLGSCVYLLLSRILALSKDSRSHDLIAILPTNKIFKKIAARSCQGMVSHSSFATNASSIALRVSVASASWYAQRRCACEGGRGYSESLPTLTL